MPTSPNDPDYQDVFRRYRESLERQRPKMTERKKNYLSRPPGYSDPQLDQSRDWQKEYDRRQRAKKRAQGGNQK